MMVIKSLITVALNTFVFKIFKIAEASVRLIPTAIAKRWQVLLLPVGRFAGWLSQHLQHFRFPESFRNPTRLPPPILPLSAQLSIHTLCAQTRKSSHDTETSQKKKKMQPDELMIPTPFSHSHSHSHSLFYFAAASSLHLPQNTVAHLGGNVKHKLWHILTDAIEEIPIPDANSGLAALWALRFAICANLLCFCFTATKDTDAKVNATVWQMNFKARRDM